MSRSSDKINRADSRREDGLMGVSQRGVGNPDINSVSQPTAELHRSEPIETLLTAGQWVGVEMLWKL
jgi:hypothetical protein